jgi:hypothetical protein
VIAADAADRQMLDSAHRRGQLPNGICIDKGLRTGALALTRSMTRRIRLTPGG